MRFLKTLLALPLLACFSLAAQNTYYAPTYEVFAKDSLLTTGNYLVYPASEVQKPTPAPKGYKPCYISTYARHGSRYVSGSGTYEAVYEFFKKALEQNALTPKGEEFARKYLEFYPTTVGRAGDLTQIGWDQHTGIAARMARNYPEIFKGKARINARSTQVLRVVQSMYSELMYLSNQNPQLQITSSSSAADLGAMDPMLEQNHLLRAGDDNIWSSSRSRWGEDYRAMRKEIYNPQAFFARLVKDYKFVEETINPYSLENAMWKIAADAQCIGDKYSFLEYFTLQELVGCWEVENFRFWGIGGRNRYEGGRNWALHVTLLEDFLNLARKDIFENGGVSAQLRFGHDLNFCCLMSLIKAPGFDGEAYDKYDVKKVFRFYRSPMAANFQLVFFKNKAGDVLVKAMINEQEISLPIPGETGPFYTWSAFESWCKDVIADAYRILEKRVAVTAHRGYWTGTAENSIESLARAQELGFWGSEFDVHLTSDGVPVVNHDSSISGVSIHDNTYETISALRLSNGEPVPTLDAYLTQGEKSDKTVLVLEIKEQPTKEKTIELTKKCISALKAHNLYKPYRVIFISFSYDACKYLAKHEPDFSNQYLTGDLSPAEVYKDGINGIDYHYSKFVKHPEWVKEAHDLGMLVNVWTVNKEETIKAMIDLGVDCITTNDPELVRSLAGDNENILK